jgi:hypothetical protein
MVRVTNNISNTITETVSNKPMVNNMNKKIMNIFLFILLIILLLFISKNWWLTQNTHAFKVNNILPITQHIGLEYDFSFHQEHSHMVYVRATEDGADLYLKTLDSSQPQQLTNDSWFEYSPLWLDTQTIVYIRKKIRFLSNYSSEPFSTEKY